MCIFDHSPISKLTVGLPFYQVPQYHGSWNKFVITITNEESKLYFDGASHPIEPDSTESGIPEMDAIPASAKIFLASNGASNQQFEVQCPTIYPLMHNKISKFCVCIQGSLVELVMISTSDLHSAITDYLGDDDNEEEEEDTEGSGSGDEDDGDELGSDTDKESELHGLEDSDDEDAEVSSWTYIYFHCAIST